jgi:formate dehydrogenase maturation protein FdhE
MNEAFYIHSKCCMAHWELVIKDTKYILQCEKCGKSSNIKISSIPTKNIKCDMC